MFKLTQAAAGIAAALLAFSAQAADFQIRGVIDLGLTVTLRSMATRRSP